MKNRMVRFIVTLCLVAAFVLGGFPGFGPARVEAESKVVKASDFTTYGRKSYFDSIVLEMDTDISLKSLNVIGDLTIKGSGKLTISEFINCSDTLTIESGTDITISDGYLKGSKGVNIKKGSNVNITITKETFNSIIAGIECDGSNVTISGNVTINSFNEGINCNGGNVTISGDLTINAVSAGINLVTYEEGKSTGLITVNSGNIKIDVDAGALQGNINITGGKLDIVGEFALSGDEINISGGELDIDGDDMPGIFADILNITGGSIKVKGENGAIECNELTVSSEMIIEEPEGGKVGQYFSYIQTKYGILDKDDNNAKYVYMYLPKQDDTKDDDKKDAGNKDGNNDGKNVGNNDDNKNDKKDDGKTTKYSNEWINGKWYDEAGNQTYEGTLSWKNNSTGWWVEDSKGWYPVSQWQKIDGIWYYFHASGYMACNEYVDGYWLNSDGSCSNDYYLTWKSNSTGWWVEDISGWWPSSQWLKIDGSWYYFDASGYMVSNQYVDGYWLSSDGACQ